MGKSFSFLSLFILLGTGHIDAIATNGAPVVDTDRLPVRTSILNPVGNRAEIYDVDGKRLQRQNVAGTGNDCFFNATGLNRAEQVQLLLQNLQDPYVRQCIANDTFLDVDSKINLKEEYKDEKFKELIGFKTYYEKYTTANELAANNKMEEADLAHDKNQNEFRVSLLENEEALTHYVTKFLATGNCMNIQHNLGDDFNTAVDAIAYLNKLAIKAYRQKTPNMVELFHEFTPANATEIAYIYHSGAHFQALLPLIPAPSAPAVAASSPSAAIAAQERLLAEFAAKKAAALSPKPVPQATAVPSPSRTIDPGSTILPAGCQIEEEILRVTKNDGTLHVFEKGTFSNDPHGKILVTAYRGGSAIPNVSLETFINNKLMTSKKPIK